MKLQFRTSGLEIDAVLLSLVDGTTYPNAPKLQVEVTDYHIADGVWNLTFGSQEDCDKFSKLIDEKFLFSV